MLTRLSWKSLLAREGLLLLPAAHDALTAKIIELAGFPAYQIGGFALAASRYALPDVGVVDFGEERLAVAEILAASTLPVLVDCDRGGDDVKTAVRIARHYEALGVSAIFLEDQAAPKRCGHMAGKSVVPVAEHAAKIRAAVAERDSPDFYILARTDALASQGVDEALRRAEKYLEAGADGVYIEGPHDVDELRQIGETFFDVPLAVSILEGGGQTPWVAPADLRSMGFDMVLYPTTVIFQVARAIRRAVDGLKAGLMASPDRMVSLEDFEQVLRLPKWQEVESRFGTAGV